MYALLRCFTHSGVGTVQCELDHCWTLYGGLSSLLHLRQLLVAMGAPHRLGFQKRTDWRHQLLFVR
jgi:hypothetical protein